MSCSTTTYCGLPHDRQKGPPAADHFILQRLHRRLPLRSRDLVTLGCLVRLHLGQIGTNETSTSSHGINLILSRSSCSPTCGQSRLEAEDGVEPSPPGVLGRSPRASRLITSRILHLCRSTFVRSASRSIAGTSRRCNRRRRSRGSFRTRRRLRNESTVQPCREALARQG
jgi:hypothetical protein